MAETLGKLLASDVFESYSAGTENKPQINQDAGAVMKKLYSVDMNIDQRSKLISEIPLVDIVVTMGCNVNCQWLPCKHREDWGLEDPTGQPEEAFIKTVRTIEERVKKLKRRIELSEIPL